MNINLIVPTVCRNLIGIENQSQINKDEWKLKDISEMTIETRRRHYLNLFYGHFQDCAILLS